MLKKIILFICFLIAVHSYASIKVTELYENIDFPPTDKVHILVEPPKEPHLVFAKIQKKGNDKISTLKLLSEMEDYGKEMGADAFVLERKVQRLPDGSYLIKSDVIKYTSSIKTLVDNGFVLNYKPVDLRAGLEMDVVPVVLRGTRFSAWAGKSRWLGQFSYYQMNIPAFFWQDGFENPKITTGIELSVSYFIHSGLNGLYGLVGYGQFKGEVGHELESVSTKFSKSYLLVGGGFKRYIFSSIYINSKIGLQYNFSADDSFYVGNQLAEMNAISPIFSFSIGYQFSF